MSVDSCYILSAGDFYDGTKQTLTLAGDVRPNKTLSFKVCR